ncbi:MAG: LD-carboxypeptidase [Proteobacteria bacterium]|nr:LD-carboxypeptidase [Pseudomonadota bacterium]
MPNFILANRLQAGDTVALIAPAFSATPLQITQGVARWEALGLKVINLAANQQNDGYFASSADQMVDKIHDVLLNPEVKALVSVRGGYGCARLLPKLDWELIAANPKIILGFSDITALLLAAHQQTGLITFHGPSASMPWPKSTRDSLQEVIFQANLARYNCEPQLSEEDVLPSTNEISVLKKGRATGELIGGNLSVLISLLKTPYLPQDWRNKILFVEDVNEEVYRLDRMFMQLKLSGILDQIKGLIFGSFNHCTTKVTNSFTVQQLQKRIAEHLNIPIVNNIMFGHQSENLTLPIGANALLNADDGYIELLHPAVR